MIPLTTLYDEYIDRPKLPEKKPVEYIVPLSPLKWGSEQKAPIKLISNLRFSWFYIFIPLLKDEKSRFPTEQKFLERKDQQDLYNSYKICLRAIKNIKSCTPFFSDSVTEKKLKEHVRVELNQTQKLCNKTRSFKRLWLIGN